MHFQSPSTHTACDRIDDNGLRLVGLGREHHLPLTSAHFLSNAGLARKCHARTPVLFALRVELAPEAAMKLQSLGSVYSESARNLGVYRRGLAHSVQEATHQEVSHATNVEFYRKQNFETLCNTRVQPQANSAASNGSDKKYVNALRVL